MFSLRRLSFAAAFIIFGSVLGFSQVSPVAARVVTSCGTQSYTVGTTQTLLMDTTGAACSSATLSGTITGNPAASLTGAAVPSSAGYTAVNVGGTLTGVTGTGTSMNVNVTGGVATGVAQGSTTSGQNLSLGGCAATTSAPTYTTAQTNALSCDTSGGLRIAGGVAQGSTTSGQSGFMIQGAVTTAAPTYTTGQTSPLSLDTTGALRTSSTLTWSNSNQVQQPTAANFNATVVGTGVFATQISQGGNTAGVAPASTAPTASQPALVVATSPNSFQFACASNSTHSIAAGDTPQIAAALNSSRQNITLANYPDATTQGISTAEVLFFSFVGSATETSGVPAAQVGVLLPGQSLSFGPVVSTQALSVNARTIGHLYYLCEQ